MELIYDWLSFSINDYNLYGAVVGTRIDFIYKRGTLQKEKLFKYNNKKAGKTLKIGGFLMFDKYRFPNINFNPILKDEEESDFLAQLLNKGFVYFNDIPCINHHDTKKTILKRLRLYFSSFGKTGYLCSLFLSIKNNYFINYCFVQKNYLKNIFLILLFFLSYFNIYIYIAWILFTVHPLNKLKGSLLTQLFFPIKLTCSMILLLKRINVNYEINSKVYKYDMK